ncbi:hypothetical protein VB796_06200 [Arcicella sp. LKC2W]|uniref:hypothetical protein n=1 Tax=Arcicella sp. LKC2W TaxID=2984198 RepID=UPI002B21E04A|nr:hypothetical protein [Arcicella sp. LKC2W]MEA5458618.1 hypothetical protein [Arcicella sp. LKC2W]
MKTNRILIVAFFLGIFIISSGAGCGSTDEPKPDNFQSLVGKWELVEIVNNITKQNGTSTSGVNKFKANGNFLAWEFFSDGRMIGLHDAQKAEARWKLSVKNVDAQDITGTLTISGVAVKELMDAFGISEIVYDISTVKVTTGGNKTLMNLQFDATKYGDYQKHLIVYIYQKI